jgi:lysine 2,3-aminomutase
MIWVDKDIQSIHTSRQSQDKCIEALHAFIKNEPFNSDKIEGVDPELYQELIMAENLEDARYRFNNLIIRRIDHYHSDDCTVDDLERVNALSCLQALRNIISRRNEKRAECSTLFEVWKIIRSGMEIPQKRRLMLIDFLFLVRGTLGRSGIYTEAAPDLSGKTPQEASRLRSDYLDTIANRCIGRVLTYSTGLDESVVRGREKQRKVILDVLGGDINDWYSYRWHLTNILTDADVISQMIELSPAEEESILLAKKLGVQFGISPYYLSLMDPRIGTEMDHAIRAQVIPKLDSLRTMAELKKTGSTKLLDFMKEEFTSPIPLVTRRYPMIAIFKPYNSCAQFCTYCQRNWEIESPEEGGRNPESIEVAMRWFESHHAVSEVLITGGDPLILEDGSLQEMLNRFGGMRHVKHLRLGTRLPVVLPMRFTEHLISILGEANRPPGLEISIVTHFEHPYEISPDALKSVQDLRKTGIMVYNQQVFTFENCRRFETVALRLALKQIGVDPYYTFNTKGKEETDHFRVPIARILQERKEEARLIPGLSRTDEPVFNIPGLGKNHLRAWQHHDLIMISPEGERVYEFHPWEKNIALAPTYVYRDVPIGRFLQRMSEKGEPIEEYESIWYYL